MLLLSAPSPVMQATIGIDFLSKTMYLEDRTVRLQLWYTYARLFFRVRLILLSSELNTQICRCFDFPMEFLISAYE